MNCLTEVMTPIKMNLNVDLKAMKKFLEDFVNQVEDIKEKVS
jgi:hypothetical protein